MRLVVDLTLPADARLISRTRRVVAGYLDEFGVDGEIVDDVALAVAEVCTNVLLHAEPAGDCFHLTAEVTSDDVIVVVEDAGKGLPPAKLDQVADLTATSGRGLNMVRELMTDVDVETGPPPQGTRVEMRRALRSSSAAERA